MESLAGTKIEPYWSVQGRIKGSYLHVQAKGHGNREYGVAVEIYVPAYFRCWLEAQNHTLNSLAGSGKRYVPMQARLADKSDTVRFQVKGTEGNRDYGYAFDIRYHHAIQPLVAWLREQPN